MGALLLSLASLAATAAVLEIAARAAIHVSARGRLPHVGLDEDGENRLRWLARSRRVSSANSILTPDPLLGWRPRPRARVRVVEPRRYAFIATTNRDGLRGKQRIAMPKPPGRVRVGVFGCSQTFGSGVRDDEAYPARLGAALPDVEVLNFGVSGYGTDQMLLYYETVGRRFGLDVVVLGFAPYHLERNVVGFRSYAKPRFAVGLDDALTLLGVPVPDPPAILRMPVGAPHPWLDRSVLLRWSARRLRSRMIASSYRPDSDAWQLTRRLVARFADDVRADGARFVVANVDGGSPDDVAPLAMAARGFALDFVDVTPYRPHVKHQRASLRLPNDPHWNPEGHRLLAAALREHLCRRQLVPCPAS